jgi:hypothetical protein
MLRPFRHIAPTLAVLCATILLSSCLTSSVSPLYDAQTIFFEPALVGVWVEQAKDKPTTITFTKSKTPEDSYNATYVDSENTPPTMMFFNVHLVKLGGKIFLDALMTGSSPPSKDEDSASTKKPSHLIARISVDGDKFYMAMIDDSKLQEGFTSGKYSLLHEIDGSDAVLTASTAELQKFVADHADDDQLFPPAEAMIRKK